MTRPPPINPAFLQHLSELASACFGAPDAPLRGTDGLAHAVREVSERYTRRRQDVAETAGDPRALAARLRFFLPRDLFKLWGPLDELATVGALPATRTPRVLDLGAGLGTTTLGLASFTARIGSADRLVVHAVDRDRIALRAMARVVPGMVSALDRAPDLPCTPVTLTTHAGSMDPARLPSGVPDGPYDFILLGLCLNELLGEQAEDGQRLAVGETLLRQLAERLGEDGVLIVLEPALRRQSRTLAAIRDRLVAGARPPHVFAPCVGCPTCPMLARVRDWCHEDVPWELPDGLAGVARDAGLRREGLTYSYLTLHAQPRGLAELAERAGPGGEAYRVVSAPLRSKGKVELELCGGERGVRLMSLDRHRRNNPDVLTQVGRGTVLSLAPGDIDDSKRGPRARLSPGHLPRVLRTY